MIYDVLPARCLMNACCVFASKSLHINGCDYRVTPEDFTSMMGIEDGEEEIDLKTLVSEHIERHIYSPKTAGVSSADGIIFGRQASAAQSVPGNNLTPPALLHQALLQKRHFFTLTKLRLPFTLVYRHCALLAMFFPMALEQVMAEEDSEYEVDDDVADLEDRREALAVRAKGPVEALAFFCDIYIGESGAGDEDYYAKALLDYEAEHGIVWDASINLNVDVGDDEEDEVQDFDDQ
nr:hypothetical protein [Tanacetum cinerariifolium]